MWKKLTQAKTMKEKIEIVHKEDPHWHKLLDRLDTLKRPVQKAVISYVKHFDVLWIVRCLSPEIKQKLGLNEHLEEYLDLEELYDELINESMEKIQKECANKYTINLPYSSFKRKGDKTRSLRYYITVPAELVGKKDFPFKAKDSLIIKLEGKKLVISKAKMVEEA